MNKMDFMNEGAEQVWLTVGKNMMESRYAMSEFFFFLFFLQILRENK